MARYVPYRRWNAVLRERLFPADLTRATEIATFDVSLSDVAGRPVHEQSVLVSGDPLPDFTAGGDDPVPATFDCLQLAVELLPDKYHADGDLSIEFYQDLRHMPRSDTDEQRRRWRAWSGQEGECPFVAVLCYLVLVARYAEDSGQGFYDALEELRKKSANQKIRRRARTQSLSKVPELFRKVGRWIRSHRSHLGFNPEAHYYQKYTYIGRLLDEAILGCADVAALQQAAFEAGLGPESADLGDLVRRLARQLPAAEARLHRVLGRASDGPILECIRGVIRDWDGQCPVHDEADGSRDTATARAFVQTELIWDPASGDKPAVHLVFRGRREARGRVVMAGHEDVPVHCTDGDYVWNEEANANLDIAGHFASQCAIEFNESGKVVCYGFGDDTRSIALRVYQPCEQPGVWRESRGGVPAGASDFVVATIEPRLIKDLGDCPDSISREVDGVTLIEIRATPEVRGLLASHGFASMQRSAIRLVGGLRLGRGNRFYSYLPPEVHLSGNETRIEPDCWKEDWKEVEPGCFIRDPDRPAGLEDRYYEFSCEADGQRRSLRVRLEHQGPADSGDEPAYRAVDSFARGVVRVAGFQVEGACPTFSWFDATVSNPVKFGEMKSDQADRFKRDAELGRYRQGGAFILGLLAARGSIDDQVFREICRSIWSARRPDDSSPPHDAEIRRQREALVALGHAEYVEFRLRSVRIHAVVMPRLRRYETSERGIAAPTSVACFIAGWTLRDLLNIEKAAQEPKWRGSVRVVLHEQCLGAWAVPPRLLLMGPPDKRPDDLLAFLAELGIPACSPATFETACAQACSSGDSPDIESWAPLVEHGRRAWEVYDPQHARWVPSKIFDTIPYPWKDSFALCAVRERIEELGRKYWRYYLVRRQQSGEIEHAMVNKETHSAAAWHAWRQWQTDRPGSQVLFAAMNVQLACVPFNARPPWWLERLICGHSGFASEWLTVRRCQVAVDAPEHPAGYPMNTGNFLPSDHSFRAQQVRLHGWRDLSKAEAKSLLWPFASLCNRPDLIQR